MSCRAEYNVVGMDLLRAYRAANEALETLDSGAPAQPALEVSRNPDTPRQGRSVAEDSSAPAEATR